MILPFFAHPKKIQSWAEAKGYSGSPYDCIYSYFETNTSLGARGTIYDYIVDCLYKNGFTGTVGDGLKAFFEAQTGVTGRIDAEKAFWENSSLDFFTGAVHGVIDDSGNAVYDDSGNLVKG